jgi:hypothetical protein
MTLHEAATPSEPDAHRRDREAMLAERAAIAAQHHAEVERTAAEAERACREHAEHLMNHFWADIAAERERDRALRRKSIVPEPPERFLS